MKKKIVFHVNNPGEHAAGIIGYTDNVVVEIESGDPGGEKGEFEDYIKQSLAEWYDGAIVTKVEPNKDSVTYDELVDAAKKKNKRRIQLHKQNSQSTEFL